MKTYKLTFTTEQGNDLTVSIPDANDTLSDSFIDTAMDDMLDIKAFASKYGAIESKKKAVLQTVTVTPIPITA